MNRLEDQAPLVLAAVGLAIATRRADGPGPGEDVVERLPAERLLPIDGHHEVLAVAHVPAHVGVALVTL